MAWVVLCTLPQWARIISRKSAEGLSTLYILLGSISGVCAIGNVMMLPSSAIALDCCNVNSGFACVSGLLGMMQVTIGIACFWVVLGLYVYFAKEEAVAEKIGRRSSIAGPERTNRRATRAWYVLITACSFALLILVISWTIRLRFPQYSQTWANVLGIAVAVFACLQWIPQVVTSFHLGHLGSLSVLSLLLTTPYTLIFCISMMVRVGIAGWSAWIVYVLVGIMQLILIIMAAVFAIRDRRVGEDGKPFQTVLEASLPASFDGWAIRARGDRPSVAASTVAPNEHPSERSPLLSRRRPSDAVSES
ncbi:hypothetical protein BAUCODRAFT_38240 [Baudoinia panamericana UAMH 10762]|uniref:PQ loop repeat protein n=1 Tax=Baudoinia panamericana (strain UAMH 10762) TaxID=717646 RepID=M2MLF4_BAUPA|nr:uncharacterized protein BAUCODRAFT_38240 [Baudoinia panamericana UAMH 10762]EMC92223.1 hypothetical protein BAUCODRAFT_38240 [Baudoinia panamericana UAMH 10762]